MKRDIEEKGKENKIRMPWEKARDDENIDKLEQGIEEIERKRDEEKKKRKRDKERDRDDWDRYDPWGRF